MSNPSVFQDSPEDVLIVYTDGGCSGNPGPGGWGFVIVNGSSRAGSGSELIRSGGEKTTTNNRMELTAVIESLKLIESTSVWSGKPVSIHTDSQYVQKGMTQWIAGWKRNGWRTASKEPVKNQDLWAVLDELSNRIRPRWIWVKGHAGIHYNEVCDRLTQEEIAKHR
ncbi:ribonuclease HI [Treponema zuelzerae]|uniref:Ribonuclease H n=1 Tax=Teretinema zuelzerae TaxID=156 RepID=A0AAE3EFY1_9SPIR|nr:ribonuclease HI [Teretinema zuelzerae]MCD1653919.1 ribonuclease HI [Teretinema zuelzerae]